MTSLLRPPRPASPIEPPHGRLAEQHHWLDGLLGLLLGFAVSGLGFVFGMRQIPGFDAGPLVDMAWRMSRGLVPNVDFPSPYPPSFSLPAKWAFEGLGAHWSSLVWLGAGFGGVLSALVFWAWKGAFGRLGALALALFCAAAMPLFDGFWWYGSSAGIVGVALMGTLCWGQKTQRKDRSHQKAIGPLWSTLGTALLQVLLLAFLWGAKPNQGIPLATFFLLALALPHAWGGQGRWPSALWLGAMSWIVLATVCTKNGAPLSAYWHFLGHLQGRLTQFPILDPHRLLSDRLGAFLAILGAIVPAGVSLLKAKRQRVMPQQRGCLEARPVVDLKTRLHDSSGLMWGAVGLFVSFASVVAWSADSALQAAPTLAAALWMGSRMQTHEMTRWRAVCWVLTALICLGLGAQRLRVQAAGEDYFWEPSAVSSRMDSGFFKGVEIGQNLDEFLVKTQIAIEQLHPKNVFFGPRAEFGYAAFGMDSPKEQPLWWDPKVAYAPDQLPAIVGRWKAQHYDLVILAGRDVSFLPNRVLDDLSQNYEQLTWKSSMQSPRDAVTILRRLPPSP